MKGRIAINREELLRKNELVAEDADSEDEGELLSP